MLPDGRLQSARVRTGRGAGDDGLVLLLLLLLLLREALAVPRFALPFPARPRSHHVL